MILFISRTVAFNASVNLLVTTITSSPKSISVSAAAVHLYTTKSASINDLKFLLELTAVQAGEYYNLRLPIAAESKSGKNWAEVH